MIRLILMLILVWTPAVHSKITKVEKRGVADDIIPCEWDNKDGVPCVTIIKPNSNPVSARIVPTTIVHRQEIERNNIVDIKTALSYVNNLSVVQSGPTGQQTSVFMRGSNSNHTPVSYTHLTLPTNTVV